MIKKINNDSIQIKVIYIKNYNNLEKKFFFQEQKNNVIFN
jgi:hypothetical protein